jgi:hypothetical protein
MFKAPNRHWLVPALCVLVAAILRIGRFPHGGSPAQFDEVSYLSNGLLLLEGETPINKYAPSGPLTWLSAAYGAGRALITLVANNSDIADYSWILRPAAALQSALFGLYADMTGLRLTAVILTLLLTLAGVLAACRLGKALGGVPGEILAGLLAASLPIFVEMSTETRPYASAWAFALLALAAARTAKPGARTLVPGILFGLAVGSHIDMSRLAPLVPLLQWQREKARPLPWAEFGRTMGIALVTFLVVAPWYLPHVLDNVRQILSVRILGVATVEYSSFPLRWFEAGCIVPLVIAIAGLTLAGLRRNWPALGCAILLGLNTILALRPSEHGLQHDGALIVMIVALAPFGVSTLSELAPIPRRFSICVALIATIVGPCLWQGVKTSFIDGRSLTPDQSIDWIEANVPADTPVYVDSGQFRSLLPTSKAADRLWADVASPFVWKEKYLHDMARFGLDDGEPPRVMSTDRMDADIGNRRRFYMLGVPSQTDRPRYDLRPVSYGSFFDMPPKMAIDQLCREGGTYLHSGAAIPDLPTPAMSWVRRDGNSTFIYEIAAGGCGR